MLGVKVDRHDPTDLHLQAAAAIRRAIADGEAKPGERLPPAKDLAAILRVNTNTVLRALRDLRDEGLVEFRRGRGITVSGTPKQGAVLTRPTSSWSSSDNTATRRPADPHGDADDDGPRDSTKASFSLHPSRRALPRVLRPRLRAHPWRASVVLRGHPRRG